MIAGLDGRHLGADRLDDTGALMAQHDRPVEREPSDAVDDMQIAMAHAGRGGAHQDLARPWLIDLDLLDRQRCMHFAKYGSSGFHLRPLARLLRRAQHKPGAGTWEGGGRRLSGAKPHSPSYRQPNHGQHDPSLVAKQTS